ncbi:MAG: hypothetical protein EXR27_14845 [Betaproteobacteria bacterium]|nr:hypothetical protein [Betaproteobacteria bacterium]
MMSKRSLLIHVYTFYAGTRRICNATSLSASTSAFAAVIEGMGGKTDLGGVSLHPGAAAYRRGQSLIYRRRASRFDKPAPESCELLKCGVADGAFFPA